MKERPTTQTETQTIFLEETLLRIDFNRTKQPVQRA